MGNSSSIDDGAEEKAPTQLLVDSIGRIQYPEAVASNSDRETVFSENVNASNQIIEKVKVDPSVIMDRKFKKIHWKTNDVGLWLELNGWEEYKHVFIDKKIDGESLADYRPLTLVTELNVSPIHAFPLFNDISPLFLSSNLRVNNFDLDFRRKVDMSMIEKNPNKRINFRTALELLTAFRLQDVEGSDPAMEYFIGKFGRDVLNFLRRPPTAKEQAIIGGWPVPAEIVDSDESDQKVESQSKTVCAPLAEQANTPGPTTGGCPSEDGDECPICLTPFAEGRELMALPCAHLFCEKCIKDWLRHDRSCPICQMNPDDEELSLALLDDEESTLFSTTTGPNSCTIPLILDTELGADPLLSNFLLGPSLGPCQSDDEKSSIVTPKRHRKKKSKWRACRAELGDIDDEKSMLAAPGMRSKSKTQSSRISYDLRTVDDEKTFVNSKRGKSRSSRRRSSVLRSHFSVPGGIRRDDRDEKSYLNSSSKRSKRRGQRRASHHIPSSRHHRNRGRPRNQRSQSFQFHPSGYELCALCKSPVNVLKDHVAQPCGHIFHPHCSGATGERGGCPFCPAFPAKWLIRKQSRWLELPPNIGRLLDDQMRMSQPSSNIVVFKGKLFEVNSAEQSAVDITHNPPRSYRIKKEEIARNPQRVKSNENSCSVM